jgi:acyl-CoA reductase-like NAD-dependent aldehyde dehydrogenase
MTGDDPNHMSKGCVIAKRIYVHQDIYDEFLREFVIAVKKLKIGGSHEEGVMIGPLQNIMQYEKVRDLVSDCASKGYKFALGGTVFESKGYFINPCIIDNPPNDSRIITEEAFGELRLGMRKCMVS